MYTSPSMSKHKLNSWSLDIHDYKVLSSQMRMRFVCQSELAGCLTDLFMQCLPKTSIFILPWVSFGPAWSTRLICGSW